MHGKRGCGLILILNVMKEFFFFFLVFVNNFGTTAFTDTIPNPGWRDG